MRKLFPPTAADVLLSVDPEITRLWPPGARVLTAALILSVFQATAGSQVSPNVNSHEAAVAELRSLAVKHASNRDFVAEAATYDDIIRLVPKDRAALRGRVFASLHMGAPQLAVRYAQLDAAEFTAEEMRDLLQVKARASIKWGGLEARLGVGPQRFKGADRGLTASSEVQKLHRSAGKIASPSGERTKFDRIVALRDRLRMAEAIEVYRDLTRRQVEIPAFALAAAADAYLYTRKPQRARDLFLQALALSKLEPDYPNREWQLHLFDAYLDANDFGAAHRWIDQLVREIPPLLNPGLRDLQRDNDFYTQATIGAARLRLASDALPAGELMLKSILDRAPFNTDARLAYGDLLRSREKTRAALRQFESILVDDLTNADAALGIAGTALLLHDRGKAKSYLAVLTENYPESAEAQRLRRELRAYERPFLAVTTERGRSPTGVSARGNRDWLLDTTLFLAPPWSRTRLFTHSFYVTANFQADAATRKRLGMGVEYRSPWWELSTELSGKQPELNRSGLKDVALNEMGLSLRAAFKPGDPWRIRLEADTQSNDIPVQASAAGINARAFGVGVTHTRNESQSLSASLAQSRFSDGNRRWQTGGDWSHRWLSRPSYKLETRLGADASQNSLPGAGYFNPRRDLSFEPAVINGWTPWRRYERSFAHTVEVGVGRYWQHGFGTGFSTSVRYAQEWNLGSHRSIGYGVSCVRHPFDGVIDVRTSVFLTVNWHL